MHRRWVTGIEIATSFVAAAVFTRACWYIHADPIDRIGQVSGMATIAFRFLLVAIPLVAAVALAARIRDGAAADTVTRFVCAALAGIASATVAAGIAFALRGTEFGLGGTSGDAGVLCSWADSIKRGDYTYSSVYPPLQVHLLVWLSELTKVPAAHAMKLFQIIGTAAIGPAAYSAWRLLMRPGWALGAAIVTIIPMIEPYRPYAGVVLVVFVPVLIKFLDILGKVGTLPLQRVMQYAAAFGLGLGLLCLLYSGWYQWSAPGFLVAVLIVFPWRDWRRGALFCGIAGIVFGLCVLHYVMGFRAGPGVKDGWFYSNALTEPAYFATWRAGAPGDFHWQPLGELGGVGVFTLLLVVGLAIAMIHGRRQPTVIGLVSILGGCWLFRLWHAHRMWATKLVQLWPRTSAEILYCMLALCVIAVYLLIQRREEKSAWRSPRAIVGVLASFLLVIMSASSSTIDAYLPNPDENSSGALAWLAQNSSRRKPSVARGLEAVVSSSQETPEFSVRALTDGNLKTYFSSAPGNHEDHEETIELHWDHPRYFNRVLLFPAPDGFPIDLELDVWDGTKWVTRRTYSYAPEPYEFMAFALADTGKEHTTGFRLRATKLRKATGTNDYVLRLAEIELR